MGMSGSSRSLVSLYTWDFLRRGLSLLCGKREAVHKKANALHGEGRRLSVRAVKAAGWAFIGAQRRALTEQADGSDAGFSQEGQTAERTVEEKVFHVG